MTKEREHSIIEAFVSLANSLAEGFDVVELLNDLTARSTELLDVASAGLLLADKHGTLHVVAASSERTRSLELFQLQREEGPCLDCFHAGTPVNVADLTLEKSRWPQFASAATAAGFASVHAIPLRLPDVHLGTLGLFGTSVGTLNDDDLKLAQALAHVASVAIVANKTVADKQTVVEQLQTALNSRVVIEQAKGVLAQEGALEMDEAYATLRRYARDRGQRLTTVAHGVVCRDISPRALLPR